MKDGDRMSVSDYTNPEEIMQLTGEVADGTISASYEQNDTPPGDKQFIVYRKIYVPLYQEIRIEADSAEEAYGLIQSMEPPYTAHQRIDPLNDEDTFTPAGLEMIRYNSAILETTDFEIVPDVSVGSNIITMKKVVELDDEDGYIPFEHLDVVETVNAKPPANKI